jgi:Fe2+ or Zn2+ uptake regulation protein
MPKKIAQMGPGPLERLFGSSMARLLDFFTIHENYEYSKTEVAECAEVSIRTVLRALPYLEEHGVVKHTRTVGNAEMYQTNTESPIIQHLHKAAQAIADIDVAQELERQG